jgi:hypothetical protein
VRIIDLWDQKIGYHSQDYLKGVMKRFASLLNPSLIRRLLAFSILDKEFAQLRTVPKHKNREEVYEFLGSMIGRNTQVTFIEFGVHFGNSFHYFLKLFTNKSSEFHGFDSFQGFPKAWGGGQLVATLRKVYSRRFKTIVSTFMLAGLRRPFQNSRNCHYPIVVN